MFEQCLAPQCWPAEHSIDTEDTEDTEDRGDTEDEEASELKKPEARIGSAERAKVVVPELGAPRANDAELGNLEAKAGSAENVKAMLPELGAPKLSARLQHAEDESGHLAPHGSSTTVPARSELAGLLTQHGKAINELRQLAQPCPEDDLELLLYILELDGNAAKACEQLLLARDHRQRFAEVLVAARSGVQPDYFLRAIQHYPYIQDWPHRAKDGAAMTLCGCESDTKALMEAVDWEDFVRCVVYMAERNHMIFDRIARTEGRLAKTIIVLDFVGVRGPPDSRFGKALAEAGKITEPMYPQAQRCIVVTNAPWFVALIVNFLKLLISPRAREKLFVSKGGVESCPTLSGHVSASALPQELGGSAAEPLWQTPPPVRS